MNGRKFVSLVLAGAAVLTLAFGSGAFTSVSAERGVSVAVVSDENAYVGYESSDVVVTDGESVDLVTVENRFAGEIAIEDVTVKEGDGLVGDVDYDTSNISSGDPTAIEWVSDGCDAPKTETVVMDVTVEGTGVWADIDGDTETRRFDVTCIGSSPVVFRGGGQVVIDAPDEDEIVYWKTDGGPNDADLSFMNQSEEVNQTTTLKPGSDNIPGVYFPDDNVSYVHPGFDLANGTYVNLGSGSEKAESEEGDISLDTRYDN